MTLYRIEAPHFVAGFVTRYNTVAVTAPILSWLLGSNIKWVRNCCQEKSWKLDQLSIESAAVLAEERQL